MNHLGNQLPQGGFVDGGVPVPQHGAELTDAIEASFGPNVAAGELADVAASSAPYTTHPELVPLVDAVALKIWQAPEKDLHPSGVLGAVKVAIDRRLSVGEKHEFFALLSSHTGVTPLESGYFAASETPEFKPHSQGFWNSVYAKPPGANGRPMTPGQISEAVHDINRSAEFRAAKVQAARIANPRRHSDKHAA